METTQLPKFLNAKHIQNILQISYPEALKLLDLNMCSVIVIGKTRRVLTGDFYRWLQSGKVTTG